MERFQKRHGFDRRQEAALTEKAQASVSTERREVVCRIIRAPACLDSSMYELVHALEGRYMRGERRIATARRNLVGDDATARS